MASFISSILDSIGGGTPSSGIVQAKPAPARTNVPVVAGQKRKAEGDLPRAGDKAQRVGNGNAISSTREIKPLPQRPVASAPFSTLNKLVNSTTPKSSPASTNNNKSTILSSNGRSTAANLKSSVPAGKATPSTTSISRPTSSSASKVESRPGTLAQNARPSKPAKKGSFKAMLEQAQLAQQSKQQAIGSIVHKPAMSARQKLAQAKSMAIKDKDAAAKSTRSGANGRPATTREGNERNGTGSMAAPGSANGKYGGRVKPKPARPQPSYQGTARPLNKPPPQPGYKGSARPNAAPVNRAPAKPARKFERDEYLGTDEDEEDGYGYDDDDRYAEASDDYSDMEAGFDDISDEEREATRQAKKDDLREQQELERLAREKAARKKSTR